MNDFFSKNNSDIIPIFSSKEVDKKDITKKIPEKLAILPLRDTVLFPQLVISISVGRENSNRLINDLYNKKEYIGVIAQKNSEKENPKQSDLYEIGTIATIVKVLKMPDGSSTTILHGIQKFKVKEIVSNEPYMKAHIELLEEDIYEETKEIKAITDSIKDISRDIINGTPNIPIEANIIISNFKNKEFLINFISSNLLLEVETKQKILEINDFKKKSEELLKVLSTNKQHLELKNEIQSKVKGDIDQQQKEFYLSQQLKTIQEELGYTGGAKDFENLKKTAKDKKWNKKTKELFDKELLRLQRTSQSSPEYNVQMNYLQFFVELPWQKYSKDNLDLKQAQKTLNTDHYGLEKIKERIIEYLSVLKLRKDMKSPILCFVGPPGVGKTSLGKSIAKSINRKYCRVALGGLRDEAEIRGHRKTYIGAMPGRILQNINRAGTSNPVMILDEIDKLSNSGFGDPSSAMLEVLDPEQNTTFYDNYLETEYDLSKVFFIATANSLNTIQPALLDRVEIINLSGYTIEEKVQIAKRHLIKKLVPQHGLKSRDVEFSDKVLEFIIENYTRESGVRNLEKVIAKVIRKIAFYKATEKKYLRKLSIEEVSSTLGVAHEKEKYITNKHIGVATGLAWTSIGGDILFIETLLSKGKGAVKITGNLGDVMKESASIAVSIIKSNYKKYGLLEKPFENTDIHIHVPEGATPKDGPSAGITICTSLLSAVSKRKIKEKLAMTGEISLRGDVLPVGGIKEKILAAKRAGVNKIILSQKNKKDIEDIEKKYLKNITFKYVQTIDEVLSYSII